MNSTPNGRQTTAGGRPVVIRYAQDAGLPMPDDVAANLTHVLAVQRKLDVLNAALTDSVEALAQSVARWQAHRSDAEEVYRALQDAGVRWRSKVAKACPGGSMDGAVSRGTRVRFAVYVLFAAGAAVYVGRSEKWRDRVNAHAREKQFDSVEVYECSTHLEMCDLEAVLQLQHAPTLNIRIERRTAS